MARLTKLRSLLKAEKLDGIFVKGDTSLRYFTGFKCEESKGNSDYYVKPRRVELLPQMNRLWKDEKTNERIR